LAAALADGVKAVLGLVFPAGAVERFADRIELTWLTHSIVSTAVLIGGLFVIFFVLERLTGSKRTAYLSRTFAHDVLYTFFYQGGFYAVLIWSALANALESRLAFLRIDALAALPGPVHWLMWLLTVDFCTYWWHRMLHTWEPMWAFHSVHHAQEEMSYISSFRMHPIEQLGQSLIMVVPLLIIGTPTWRWLPLFVLMILFEAAQHSSLNFTYGRAYSLVVSPRFHALHHSRDAAHYNGNYGKVLSVWDFLFGTAIRAERPERYGVEGLPVPRTLWDHFATPFRLLRRRPSGEQPSA
jgi:sterol desaturase/sphingolipid hydroxylase (fatty acid hydroxylase superfamily)